MRSFRDIKRNAREDLHREMRVPAFYIAATGASPVLVHVRLHTKFEALGDQTGTNFNSAEMTERQPRIVFMRDEVPAPARNAFVIIEAGEGYRLDNADPADGISISVNVVPLTAAQMAGLPVPGAA